MSGIYTVHVPDSYLHGTSFYTKHIGFSIRSLGKRYQVCWKTVAAFSQGCAALDLSVPAEPVTSDERGSERRIRHRECRCKSAGRRSAHLGGLNLTNSNKNVRSRTSAALAAVREAADHRLLDARTQGTRARAPVKVRPQKSHGEKLERCAKLRKVSDLMHAEDGVGRDGAVTAFWSSTRRLLLLHHGRAGCLPLLRGRRAICSTGSVCSPRCSGGARATV